MAAEPEGRSTAVGGETPSQATAAGAGRIDDAATAAESKPTADSPAITAGSDSGGAAGNRPGGGQGDAGQETSSQEDGRVRKSSSEQASGIKPGADRPTGAGAAQPPAPPARKPTVLYGRIEEIVAGPGARLPVQLKALTPKLDTSRRLQSGASALLGKVVSSYPVDWRGFWSGTLKVHAAVFDPVRWQFDPEEASKERELLRPGTQGRVTFNFTSDRGGRIYLEPARVIFSAPMDRSRYAEMLNQLQSMLGAQAGQGAMLLQSVPYLYALHLGDLSNGVGVTGNLLQSRVVKNEITQLADGVLEQVVVTYNLVRNPTTGKTRYGYSESVVRFTRQSSNQLYVQAATVSYLQNGKFEDKTILYGTVARATSHNAVPNPFQGLFDGMLFPQ
ncbi:MAG TPA: hypothetical protein V6D08_12935 [Candidatus Obscuribacterales bacterium]